MNQPESDSAFKICPMCKQRWQKRKQFLDDPLLELKGYQADIEDPEYGLFLFNHNRADCGSTISIRVGRFRDLYDGPMYSQCLLEAEECRKLCLHKSNLDPCPLKCECSYVRDIIQTIKHWGKG